MLPQLQDNLNEIVLQTQDNLPLLGKMLAILWGIFLLSRLFPPLLYLGIIPRRLIGLPGILFAPLLHADFNHLFFNSIPLVVLSSFLLVSGLDYFVQVSVLITLSSGLLIWCFGPPAVHVGASALISGYWGLLVSNIVYEGTLTAIILGLISLYYFAGIFLGIIPSASAKNISWKGHLFGLLSGVAVGHFFQPF